MEVPMSCDRGQLWRSILLFKQDLSNRHYLGLGAEVLARLSIVPWKHRVLAMHDLTLLASNPIEMLLGLFLLDVWKLNLVLELLLFLRLLVTLTSRETALSVDHLYVFLRSLRWWCGPLLSSSSFPCLLLERAIHMHGCLVHDQFLLIRLASVW